MACVYKQGWCLQTGMSGGGLEVLECLETWHPPPSRLTAQLRHRRLHLLFSFPFVPNPQSHSPFPLTMHHIAKTKRALAPFPQTIPLCLSSVEEHVECWIFRIQHNFVRRCCENAGMYDVFCVWCVWVYAFVDKLYSNTLPCLWANGLFRPCELLIESCIFLWFQGFGLYTDRRDVHIKDSRKDGRHTASWTRRIPGSLILTSIIVYFTFQ